MHKLRTKKVNVIDEKRVLTGMIVSGTFLREIQPFFNYDYFQSKFAEKVARWCMDYYEQYDTAPLLQIQDIYNVEKRNIPDEDAEIIADLLTSISEKYEAEGGFNTNYFLDQAITFFKRRELEITADNIKFLLDNNDVKKAEDQIRDFIKVERLFADSIDPLSQEAVLEALKEDYTHFFKFPGRLGNFLGPLDRGWCVSISGAFKIGKSFWLEEFAIIGLLSGYRVAFFSLEMTRKEMVTRSIKRLLSLGGDEDGDHIYPVFDCLRNQSDECDLSERENRIELLLEDGTVPEFDEDMDYRVCTFCRDQKPSLYSPSFEPSTWFEVVTKKAFDRPNIMDGMNILRKQFGGRMRLKTYPRFSANVADIKRELDLMERTDEFVPDIIVIDYADILKPERVDQDGVQKEDETWMSLAGLAGERYVLLVTATQITRTGIDAKNVTQKHTAKWVGKLAHVDVMMSLNQTELEKKMGVMRIGMMAHRHADFLQEETCKVLQKIEHGQVHLDSH